MFDDRRLIKEDDLEEFMAYCRTQGWENVPTLGQHLSVRMRHKVRDIIEIGNPVPQMNAHREAAVRRYPLYHQAARMYDEWQERQKARIAC